MPQRRPPVVRPRTTLPDMPSRSAAMLRQALLAGVSLYAIAVTGEAQALPLCSGNVISTFCPGPITPAGTMTSFSVTSAGEIRGYDGIDNSAATLSILSNAGTISGTATNGIDNYQSIGSVVNTGIVSGLWSGIGVFSSDSIAGSIYASIGTLVNAGVLYGTNYGGLSVGTLSGVGAVTNQTSGRIGGGSAGIYIFRGGSIGALTNAGTISGGFWGVGAAGSLGTLTNDLTGTIGAGSGGPAVAPVFVGSTQVGATASLGTLVNNGLIDGSAAFAGVANAGALGFLNNGASGTILGYQAGIANIAGSGPVGSILAGYSLYLQGAGTIGALTNSGYVSGGVFGAYNEGSIGSLTNSGTIGGGSNGIKNLGSIGTLTNSGAISAGGAGISNLGGINGIRNAGLINGSGTAVYNLGSIGTLTNSGTISGGTTGLWNNGGTIGQLDIQAGGIVTAGQNGIAQTGGTIGVLSNAGSIINANLGIWQNAGGIGTLANLASGTISGAVTAIYLQGGSIGTLSNSGVIVGVSQYGIRISPGVSIGVLSNQAGGVITGNWAAISNVGSIGVLSNAGTISSSAGNGVVNYGSLDTLGNSGFISVGYFGVWNTGAINVVDNSGTIQGLGGTGLFSFGTIGALTNRAGGMISGGYTGISAGGSIGTLSNNGLLQGGFVGFVASGTIGLLSNLAGGTISGGYTGIINSNGSIGQLTNIGVVNGGTNIGIYNLGSIGQLNSSGLVNGGTIGIKNAVSGSSGFVFMGTIGTLTNSGTISGGGTGIYNASSIGQLTNAGIINGGTIGIRNATSLVSGSTYVGSIGTLTNSGTISGQQYGLDNQGTIGLVNNSGTIIGVGITGLKNAGYIGTLTNSGLISGYSGVYITDTGSIGTLSNSGTIIGKSGLGMDHRGGLGLLANSGLIQGGSTGIAMVGSIGLLSNTGTIIGVNYIGIEVYSTGTLHAGSIGVLTNAGVISGGQTGIWVGGTGAVIDTLTNSGTITGGTSGILNAGTITGGGTTARTIVGSIGMLTNSGVISGGQTGIRNMGVMGPLVNSGTITGGLYALNSNGTLAAIGPITNSGVINGNVRVGNQDVSILGGSGDSFGTIMGGSVVISGGNLTFGVGNQLLASSVNVRDGAGTVTLGGTLQANIPIAISGNLLQNNGSLLILGINAASQGRLNVTGTVDMTNGAVRFQPLNGFKLAPNGTYTLVDSATPVGTSYAGVQVTAVGYRGFITTPTVDGHYDLVLNIRGSDYTAIGRASGATPGNMGSTLDQLAANNNQFQQQVLSRIDDLPEGKRQQDAVRQTAPVQTAPGAVALNVSAAPTTQVVEQHQIGLLAQNGRAGGGMAAGSGGSKLALWMQVMGGYSNRGTTATVDGYSSRSGGMMIGMDYNLSPTAVVGIGTSMLQGRTNTGGVTTGSTTSLTNYSVTAYGSWQFRPDSFVFGQAGGGSNSFTQRRRIGFLGATARSQFSGDQMQVKGGLGHDVHLTDSVTLTPMATLQYLRADTQGYGETGAGLANLRVNRSGVDALVHEVGARVSGRLETPLGMMLPEARLSWTHDYIAGPIAATGQMAGASFFSTTPRLAPNGARLNLASTLLYSDRLTVRAEYQGDLRSNYQAHTGLVRASLAF